MSDTFDWAGLQEALRINDALLNLIRTRIEAAFVPIDRLHQSQSNAGERLREYVARAEAAEARVNVLEMHVDILEQALIDHNCGSPSCICVGCIEKRDPALGAEHER